MAVVTPSELRAALRRTVGRRGMSETDIATLADYLLSFFGYRQEVIDNRLDVADRDVFYLLEEEGLLGTRQEEVHIRRGKLWRIHYWILRVARIKELASKEGPKEEEGWSLYDDIPEEVWARE
jgi:hypothetical protein